jgi:hypothetical protein
MPHLRAEVIGVMRKLLVDPHNVLESLPAWFTCDDDIAMPAGGRLRTIAAFDKQLGALAYVPAALTQWLKEKKEWRLNADAAVNGAQSLLAERAHTIWLERCKTFETQWRAESTRRKEQAQKEQADDEERRKRADDAVAAMTPMPHTRVDPVAEEMAIVRQIVMIDGSRLTERRPASRAFAAKTITR